MARGVVREAQRLGIAGVGDADKHWNTARNLPAGTLDELTAQLIAERGAFTGSSENEQAIDAACSHMFDQPLEASMIEFVWGG